ncbi:cytidine deaminase-like protein [Biscogniauxia marginata]|nr:cytidine deaminase-like protein [Biscogniauxia marginata]
MQLPFTTALYIALSFIAALCHTYQYQYETGQCPVDDSTLPANGIPLETRAHWMRQANLVLKMPCPFAAFGSVVVNHTKPGLGELVCTGANARRETGNPTLHGEISAINNCSNILKDLEGPHALSPSDAAAALTELSIYTNAESCPMCASAIRYAGFKEYIYGTSIDKLVERGWSQIHISSLEVFRQSFDLPHPSRLINDVLANETDPYFSWQYDSTYPCPKGCSRVEGICEAN